MTIDVLITPASGTIYISGSEAQTPTPPNLTNGTNYLWASGTTLQWGNQEVYTNDPGSSEITGGGAADQVAFYSASSTITGSANLTFDGSTLIADADIRIKDGEKLLLGTDSTLQIYGDAGSTKYITALEEQLLIWNQDSSSAPIKIQATDTTNGIQLNIAGTEKMRVNSSGVGIGTTPGSKLLTVNGTTQIDGEFFATAGGDITAGSWRWRDDALLAFGSDRDIAFVWNDTNQLLYLVSGNSGSNNKLWSVDVSGNTTISGNVGIGATPTDKLNINTGAGTFDFRDYNLTYTTSLGIRAEGGGYLGLVTEGANDVFISTNGFSNKRLVVNSDGDVGINTVAPEAKLDVRGSVIASGNIDTHNRVRYGPSTAYFLDFSNTSTGLTLAGYQSFRATVSGNAYGNGQDLGTTSYPWDKIYSQGLTLSNQTGGDSSPGAKTIWVSGSDVYWGTSKLNAQSGGGGTPGGSNTQLQYNNGGSFGGMDDWTWDGTDLSAAGSSKLKFGASLRYIAQSGDHLYIRNSETGGNIELNAKSNVKWSIDGATKLTLESNDLTLAGDSTAFSINDADGTETVRLGTASGDEGLLYLRGPTGGNSIYLDGNSDSYISNGANLGIGTTSPDEKLDVRGDIQLKQTGDTAVTVLGDANRTNADAHVAALRGKWNGTAVGTFMVMSGPDTTNKDDGQLTFQTASAGTLAERMRIDETGSVGIGTTEPSHHLHVVGNGMFTGGVTVGDSSADTFTTRGHTHLATLGNNVGIGTTGPNAKLEVRSTSNPQIRVSYNDSHHLDIYASNGTGYIKSDGRFRASSSTARYFFHGNATSTGRAEMFISAGGDIANKRLSSFLYLLRGYQGADGAGIYFGNTVSGSDNEGSTNSEGREGTQWYAGLNYAGGGATDEWILGTDYRTTSGSGADGYTPVIAAQKTNTYGPQGKVGINILNPQQPLHVLTSANDQGILIDVGDDAHEGRLLFGDTSSNAIGHIGYNHSLETMRFTVGGYETVRMANDGSYSKLFLGGDSTLGLYRYSNRMDFYISSNPRMHLDASKLYSATSGGPLLDLTPTAGEANYAFVDDVDSGLTRSAANTIHLLTAGVSGMTMDSSQNVGIGTTSPAQKLDVNGNVQIGDGGTGGSLRFNTTDRGVFTVNGSEIMRLKSNGRVGIGTSSPAELFNVESASNTLALFKSTDNRGLIQVADDDTTASIVAENSTLSLGLTSQISAANVNISAVGHIGVGNTAPTFGIDVSGASTRTAMANVPYIFDAAAGFQLQAAIQPNAGNIAMIAPDAGTLPAGITIPVQLPASSAVTTGLEITVVQDTANDPGAALAVEKAQGSSDVIYEGGSNSASSTVSIAANRGANKTFINVANGVWVVKD